MEPLDEAAIEERIRDELAVAFSALEHASPEERPRASSRLNRAIRRLYDFVGYGRLPAEWRFLNVGE